jgi:hypothetical protein
MWSTGWKVAGKSTRNKDHLKEDPEHTDEKKYDGMRPKSEHITVRTGVLFAAPLHQYTEQTDHV